MTTLLTSVDNESQQKPNKSPQNIAERQEEPVESLAREEPTEDTDEPEDDEDEEILIPEKHTIKEEQYTKHHLDGHEEQEDEDDGPLQKSFDNSQLVFQKKPLDPILDNCDTNPDFAVICSFITQFGDKLDLQLDIDHLKTSIENQSQSDDRLIDIHVKLLKKIRRYFVRDLWQKALVKYVAEYSYQDAWELEELGYAETRPSIKLQLLARLLDAQFEVDQKFKGIINSCDADKLRLLPLGRDYKGNSYWKHVDKEGNFRIYQEEPMNYKSWRTICSKPEELNYLIEEIFNNKDSRIKGEPMTVPYNPLPEIFPELFPEKEQTVNDQTAEEEEEATTSEEEKEVAPKAKSDFVDEEFAGEDEDTNVEPVIVKRARTARQSVANNQNGYAEESFIDEEDKPCGHCDKSNDPENILLCDMCDDGYHTTCCLPPLMVVPDGDWYCPPCEHRMLLTKLKSTYAQVRKILDAKEKERLRRERERMRREKDRIRKEKALERARLRFEEAKKEPIKLVIKKEPKPKTKRPERNFNERVDASELDELLGPETDEEEEQMSSYSGELEQQLSSSDEETEEEMSYHSSETEDDDDEIAARMSIYSDSTEERASDNSQTETEVDEDQMSVYSTGPSEDEIAVFHERRKKLHDDKGVSGNQRSPSDSESQALQKTPPGEREMVEKPPSPIHPPFYDDEENEI